MNKTTTTVVIGVGVGVLLLSRAKKKRDWRWPVPGFRRLSSKWGPRPNPFGKPTKEVHKGLDIPAPRGTPVVAAIGGVVWRADVSTRGGGKIVYIKSGPIETRYMHLSSQAVKGGDVVKAGQKIGAVGTTGRSTGPHLHFAILVDGVLENPAPYLGLPT